MQILLIRHGQSIGNIEGIIQGDDDPLTELGHAQADAVGMYLADAWDVTHLYASPLARSKATAEQISQRIGLVPVWEPGLAEINAGHAAGMGWVEWRAANPELAKGWSWGEREANVAWPGGESGRIFSERVFRAWDDIVASHVGTDDVVVVVSHGGVLAWLAARLHGDSLERWPAERAGFGNCSVSVITVSPDGDIEFGPWNQTDHLPDVDQPT